MKLNLRLVFIATALSTTLGVQAAEVGEMSAEDTECRLENGNVEPPTGLLPQFQPLPVEGKVPLDTKESSKGN